MALREVITVCREPVKPEERWNPRAATPDLDGDEAEANVGLEGGSDDGTGQVRPSACHFASSTTALPPVELAAQRCPCACNTFAITLLSPTLAASSSGVSASFKHLLADILQKLVLLTSLT